MTTETATPTTEREPALRGQTVVVIGGSAGIGLETARGARTEGTDGHRPDRADIRHRRRAAARRELKGFTHAL